MDDLAATGLPRRWSREIGSICQELPKISDHEIGAVFTKRLGLIVSIHTDHESEAAGVPGSNPRQRILDHDRTFGGHPQPPRRL